MRNSLAAFALLGATSCVNPMVPDAGLTGHYEHRESHGVPVLSGQANQAVDQFKDLPSDQSCEQVREAIRNIFKPKGAMQTAQTRCGIWESVKFEDGTEGTYSVNERKCGVDSVPPEDRWYVVQVTSLPGKFEGKKASHVCKGEPIGSWFDVGIKKYVKSDNTNTF